MITTQNNKKRGIYLKRKRGIRNLKYARGIRTREYVMSQNPVEVIPYGNGTIVYKQRDMGGDYVCSENIKNPLQLGPEHFHRNVQSGEMQNG